MNCWTIQPNKNVFILRVTFLLMAQQPLMDQGLLIIEASRPHSVTHTALGKTPLDE